MKKFLRTFFICFFCGSVFFTTSYLYLLDSLKNGEKAAYGEQKNVPYYDPPESSGLLFSTPDEKYVSIFLDFEQEVSYIIYIDNKYDSLEWYINYPIDYYFDIDCTTLSLLIDRLGGIDLESEGEVLRFTGVQVCDALRGDDSTALRRAVAGEIIKRIQTGGFSEDDFVFLIENCGCDLNLPVCLTWQKFIPVVLSNAYFINWEV